MQCGDLVMMLTIVGVLTCLSGIFSVTVNVHSFAFLKYPRKYVHLENYFYISLKSKLYTKREF